VGRRAPTPPGVLLPATPGRLLPKLAQRGHEGIDDQAVDG
jgi:hypothetical protein